MIKELTVKQITSLDQLIHLSQLIQAYDIIILRSFVDKIWSSLTCQDILNEFGNQPVQPVKILIQGDKDSFIERKAGFQVKIEQISEMTLQNLHKRLLKNLKSGAKKDPLFLNTYTPISRKKRERLLEICSEAKILNIGLWWQERGSKDLLNFFPKIDSCNVPIIYAKDFGSMTGIHTQLLNLCAVNVNLGPSSNTWFVSSTDEFQLLEQQFFDRTKIFLSAEYFNIWPSEEWCQKYHFSPTKIEQKSGDIIITSPGIPHFVVSKGFSFGLAWNLCPYSLSQHEMLRKRIRKDKVQSFINIFPTKMIMLKFLESEVNESSQKEIKDQMTQYLKSQILLESKIQAEFIKTLPTQITIVPEKRQFMANRICESCNFQFLMVGGNLNLRGIGSNVGLVQTKVFCLKCLPVQMEELYELIDQDNSSCIRYRYDNSYVSTFIEEVLGNKFINGPDSISELFQTIERLKGNKTQSIGAVCTYFIKNCIIIEEGRYTDRESIHQMIKDLLNNCFEQCQIKVRTIEEENHSIMRQFGVILQRLHPGRYEYDRKNRVYKGLRIA